MTDRDDELGTLRWFGEPWPNAERPAPICADERTRIPVPVGQECTYCASEFVDGDQGVTIPYVDRGEGQGAFIVRIVPAHAGCFLRTILGPMFERPRRRSR